jgi:hypothetical protein
MARWPATSYPSNPPINIVANILLAGWCVDWQPAASSPAAQQRSTTARLGTMRSTTWDKQQEGLNEAEWLQKS